MAIQTSDAVENARLEAIETQIGTSPRLRIRTGAQPASCAASRTGTVLATLVLPSDWLSNAASRAKAIANGPWEDTSADASGTAAHFEIMDSSLTTCHMQGSVTVTGGGGDLTLDNVTINSGQAVRVTSFTLNGANA